MRRYDIASILSVVDDIERKKSSSMLPPLPLPSSLSPVACELDRGTDESMVSDMLDQSNRENPRWAFQKELSLISPKHLPLIGSSSEPDFNKHVKKIDMAFLNCISSRQSYFFVSRLTSLLHNFSVVVVSPGGAEEKETLWFSGTCAANMRPASTLHAGPCCKKASPTGAMRVPQDRFTDETRLMVDAIHAILLNVNPRLNLAVDVAVTYFGAYKEVTVTEFVVHTEAGRGAVEDLRDALEKDLAGGSALSAMDRLDLDCMLSILPSMPRGLAEDPPAHRLCEVASARMIFDERNCATNWDSLVDGECVDMAASSLHELSPTRESYFFHTGLNTLVPAAGTVPIMQLQLRDPKTLATVIAAASDTVRRIESGTYIAFTWPGHVA